MPAPAGAEEQPEEFLAALRQRGYFDTAADYLSWARTSSLISDEFKAGIPYEEALTLVRQADAISAAPQRERQLEAAREKLQQFAAKEPSQRLIHRVRIEIARIDSLLGQTKLRLAERSDADKESLRGEARKLFDSAFELAGHAEQPLREQLSDRTRFPVLIPPTETKLLKEHADLLRDLVGAETLLCSLSYDLSQTYESGSSESLGQLGKAAAAYGKLYREYPKLYAGIQARLLEGRCLEEKGDSKKALECFADFLRLSEKQLQDSTLKMFYAQALAHSMEIWIGEKKYDQAIQAVALKLAPAEARQAEWLAVRFFEAKALKLKADTLQDKKRERDAALSQAASLAQPVAATPGAYQLQARKLLDEMGLATASAKGEPRNFAEALDRAILAQQKWNIVREVFNKAAPEKQQQLKNDLAEERRAAIGFYRTALSLADESVPANQLNLIDHSLSFLYLEDENYLAAAVLGEHVARDYPDAPEAKDAAQFALAAWRHEYALAEEPRRFERERIISMARYMIQHWPDADQSADATLALLDFAVRDGNAEEASQLLARIPKQSPYRGAAELRVGSGLWRAYLTELRKPAASRLSKEKLTALRDNVEKLLPDGIERMQDSGTADASLVVAVLYLAQLYVDTNRPQEALRWLEDPKVGSLTILAAGDPNAQKEAFRIETYKVAMRCYIGLLPKYKNDKVQREALLKKAEGAMDALEKAVGNDDQAAERLTRVYLVMGKDLEGQLLGVRDDPQAKEALSTAFEEFLSRILQRPGNAFSALVWVGEMYFNLGSAADTGERPIPPAARKYFTKAASTYEQILRTAAVKPEFLPNEKVKLDVKMRLAQCYRRMAAYGQALDVLETVLKLRHNSLPVQIEAAEILEQRGAAEDSRFFEKAIHGDRPDESGRNVFWGWVYLAKATGNEAARDRTFESYYFRATYESNECRYLWAMNSVSEQKALLLETAKKSMNMTYLRFPDLGGPDRKADYDRLLRQVQQELKEPPIGLKAFDKPATAAPTHS